MLSSFYKIGSLDFLLYGIHRIHLNVAAGNKVAHGSCVNRFRKRDGDNKNMGDNMVQQQRNLTRSKALRINVNS